MNKEITYKEKHYSYYGCEICGSMGEDNLSNDPCTRIHERLGYDVCIKCSRTHDDASLVFELNKVWMKRGSEKNKKLTKFEEGTQLYNDRTLVDFSGVEYCVISVSDAMITVQITDRGWDTLQKQIGSHEQMIVEECRYLCRIPNIDEDAEIYAQIMKNYRKETK